MTTADWLTIGRMIVSPAVLVLFVSDGTAAKVVAFLLFSLGAISDYWDGYIARKTKLSHFGKIGDPIADKLLTGFALITLSIIEILPWWITIALILRDVIVTSLRLWSLRRNGTVILPTIAAKLKTTAELIMLVALLGWATFFANSLGQSARYVILVYACCVVALSWATAIWYIVRALR